MADPSKSFSNRKSNPNGVGPYRFTMGALVAGDYEILDLREFERGRYVTLSSAGYDSLQVTNSDGSNSVVVKINDGTETKIPPNAVEEIGQSGMYRFEVINKGSTQIAAGDVELEILKEPYGADERAREQSNRPTAFDMVEHFTGISL